MAPESRRACLKKALWCGRSTAGLYECAMLSLNRFAQVMKRRLVPEAFSSRTEKMWLFTTVSRGRGTATPCFTARAASLAGHRIGFAISSCFGQNSVVRRHVASKRSRALSDIMPRTTSTQRGDLGDVDVVLGDVSLGRDFARLARDSDRRALLHKHLVAAPVPSNLARATSSPRLP